MTGSLTGLDWLKYDGDVCSLRVPSHKKGCPMANIVQWHFLGPILRNKDGSVNMELTSLGLVWTPYSSSVTEVVKAFKKVGKIDLLRKLLKPGVQTHCMACKSVWDKLQRVLHDKESCEPMPEEKLLVSLLGGLTWVDSIPKSQTEVDVSASVPLVSDKELLTKISEIRKIRAKQPTSIKKICQILKDQKPEWLVTETRLKKLSKTEASFCLC
jgi:hypothetical protein